MNLSPYIKPKFNEIFITKNQSVKDLSDAVVKAINESVPQVEKVKWYFDKGSKKTNIQNAWNWTKKNIRYNRENSNNQTVKTFARMVVDKNKLGDCKHYTISNASILLALGYPVTLKMVSFNYFDKEPKHIYVVCSGVVLDCCMNYCGEECSYKHAQYIDLKPIK